MKTASITIHYVEGFSRSFKLEYGSLGETPFDLCGMVFHQWNAGSGQESKDFTEAHCRSLSVGDFVVVDGQPFQCKSNGFELVKTRYMNDVLNRVWLEFKTQHVLCYQTFMERILTVASNLGHLFK